MLVSLYGFWLLFVFVTIDFCLIFDFVVIVNFCFKYIFLSFSFQFSLSDHCSFFTFLLCVLVIVSVNQALD